MNDPFIAVVIDPIKTTSFRNLCLTLEKIDIGAFRVYNKGYKEVESS